jgi:hypothetical protein
LALVRREIFGELVAFGHQIHGLLPNFKIATRSNFRVR